MQSEGASLSSGSTDGHVDPVTGRAFHRLTTLHALDVDHLSLAVLDRPAPDQQIANILYLGRLGPYYEQAAVQFPTVLLHQACQVGVTGRRVNVGIELKRGCSWLFRVPNGGLVAGLTIDFESSLRACIPLLEDAYYGEVLIEQRSLMDHLRHVTTDTPLGPILAMCGLATHGHQLLFVGGDTRELVRAGHDPATREVDQDLIRRLIYRFDVPYRQDSGTIRFPAETNRRMTALAACGPYFSLFAGQQDYIENAALIAAVQLVGSMALLSVARSQAYAALGDLRTLHAEVDDPEHGLSDRRARRRLAKLSEVVGRLELDLSFGVEAFHEVGALVPSLRVSDLHCELFDAAAVPRQTRSVAQMLDRLARAVAAEAASVLATERARDERRRLTWGVAVGFASFVAIPLTLVFGFFAVTTTDVSRGTSLLEIGRYKWFYASVGGLMLLTVALALSVWLRTRDRDD